jgi:dTDP-4-amino-4,6-dideoxygalactose transaminase
MKIIPVAKPEIGKAERKAVDRVMRSGLLAQGTEVSNFEKEFSKFVEDRECVAVNSGTSALHVALLSLGIGKGDEVIVPSFTFAATANSVALTGAKPVFIDIDPNTFCIDPTLIVEAITPKTKAIQVVHLYGLPANMPAIMKIAKKYKLLVIEDAAQAHLASIEGKPVGSFGDAAAFSFYPTKNMTSGEGGMIVYKDSAAARLGRLYRNQGMEKRYENEIVGFNLRMTDIHASIGRVQLSQLDGRTKKRQENAAYLSKHLSEYVVVPTVPYGYSHVFHQYTIKIEGDRDKFASKLTELGVGSGVYYPIPVHELPAFGKKKKLSNTSIVCNQVLSLPVHPLLSPRDLKKIVNAVKKASLEK